MLYHTSKTPCLQVLEPHISSHGVPWVYAIDNAVTSLLFGTEKDDFNFLMDQRDAHAPEVWEC